MVSPKFRKFVYIMEKIEANPQCGNFRIFLSLKFYVKSILENLDVVKLPFFATLAALNLFHMVNFNLQNV